MKNVQKRRLTGKIASACVCAALAMLTMVWPDWIEAVFGVDPDAHSGAVEWSIVLSLGTASVILGALARFEWRRSLNRA
jgi:hypothetical protein